MLQTHTDIIYSENMASYASIKQLQKVDLCL